MVAAWWAPRWHSVWTFFLLVAIATWLLHVFVRLVAAFRSRGESSRGRSIALSLVLSLTVGAIGAYAWFVIAAPSEEFRVTNTESSIHGEFYRVIRIEPAQRIERARPVPVALLQRRLGNTVESMRVERGKWWASRAGNYELALARARRVGESAVFRHREGKLTLDLDKPARQGVLTFLLRALHRHPHDPSMEVNRAEVEIGGQKKVLPLDPEWAGESAFLGMKESPTVILRVHRNLTTPLAVLAIGLLGFAALLARLDSRTRSNP